MNTNIECIYEVIEDIKETITDNQYKIVMDNLMVLNKIKIDKNVYVLNKYKYYERLFNFINSFYIRETTVRDKISVRDIYFDYVTSSGIYSSSYHYVCSDIRDIIINYYNLNIEKSIIIGLSKNR